jgi:hypothetical protein
MGFRPEDPTILGSRWSMTAREVPCLATRLGE